MDKKIELKNIDSNIPTRVIEITVKTMTGKTIVIPMMNTETIGELKNTIQHMEGTPINKQRITFAGQWLEDSATFSEYNITNGSTLHLVLRAKGDGCLTLKNRVTNIEENIDWNYAKLTVGQVKSEITDLFDIDKKSIKIYVNEVKIDAKNEVTIDQVGVEPGVDVEFSYTNYKDYVDTL